MNKDLCQRIEFGSRFFNFWASLFVRCYRGSRRDSRYVVVGTLRLLRFAKTTHTGYQCQKNRRLQILDLSQNVRFRAIAVLSVPPSGHILIANALSDVMMGFPATDE